MEQRIPATMRDSSTWSRYAPSAVGTRYDLVAVLTRQRQSGRARSA
jgi:hypothetical protein